MDGAAAHRAAVNASLYQRLGGAEAVAAVIDETIDRHAANPVLAHRFRGQDLPQLKILAVSFISAGAGGPCLDLTPGATPQYAGMRFCPAELEAVLGDLADTLLEQSVRAAEIEEVLGLFRASSGEPPGTNEERGLRSLQIHGADPGPDHPRRR